MGKIKAEVRQIGEHREKIGKTTFIVTSYDNSAAQTSEKLLLGFLETKVAEENKQERGDKSSCGN